MAFNENNGGGPWGGKGNNENNPWGSGGGRNTNPPDFDEFFNNLRNNFGKFIPSGSGGGRFFLIIVSIIFVIWLLSGFYIVGTPQQGVILRFGDFIKTTFSPSIKKDLLMSLYFLYLKDVNNFSSLLLNIFYILICFLQ